VIKGLEGNGNWRIGWVIGEGKEVGGFECFGLRGLWYGIEGRRIVWGEEFFRLNIKGLMAQLGF